MAAARLQRWAILLSAYKYEIQYKSTHEHSNADGLSRLPLSNSEPVSTINGAVVFNIGQIQALPVTCQAIQKATARDRLLSEVHSHVQRGWPDTVDPELKPYKLHENEIGIESGCLMWGIRVIVPVSLQPALLKSLHETHPGITKMKSIARSYFWWNGMDKDIENHVKNCTACQAGQNSPTISMGLA